MYQANDHCIDCDDFIEINPNTFHPEAQLYGIEENVKEILTDLFLKNNFNMKPAKIEVWLKSQYKIEKNIVSNKVGDVEDLVLKHEWK